MKGEKRKDFGKSFFFSLRRRATDVASCSASKVYVYVKDHVLPSFVFWMFVASTATAMTTKQSFIRTRHLLSFHQEVEAIIDILFLEF